MATFEAGNGEYVLTATQTSISVEDNTSLVHVTLTGRDKEGLSHSASTCTGTVSYTGPAGTITDPISYAWSSASTATRTLYSSSHNLTHNADGTATATISFSFSGVPGTTAMPAVSGSIKLTLSTIPRASTIRFAPNGLTAGATATVYMDAQSTSFTHRLRYSFGSSTTYVIADRADIGPTPSSLTATTVWNIPVDLLTKIPNSASGTGTFYLDTYSSSGSLIGTTTRNFPLYAGADAVPTVGALATAETDATVKTVMGSDAGVYLVQGKSKFTVTVNNAAGYQDSTVKSIKAALGGVSASISAASGALTLTPTGSGNQTLTVTVTDSRGMSASSSQTVHVLAYKPPALSGVTAYRASDAAGTAADDGTFLAFQISKASVSPLTGTAEHDTLTLTINTSPAGPTDTWTQSKTPVAAAGLTYTGPLVTDSSGFVFDQSFDVQLVATDVFGSQAITTLTVSTAHPVMALDDVGVGVGKYRENGALDVEGQVFATGFLTGAGDNTTANMNAGGLNTPVVNVRNADGSLHMQINSSSTSLDLLPAPIGVSGPDSSTVTTTTVGANLPSMATISLTLTHRCLVDVRWATWLEGIGTADARVGVAINGPNPSPANDAWAEVVYCPAGIAGNFQSSKVRVLDAGTHTFTFQAWRGGTGGTGSVAYPRMTVVPLRWA